VINTTKRTVYALLQNAHQFYENTLFIADHAYYNIFINYNFSEFSLFTRFAKVRYGDISFV